MKRIFPLTAVSLLLAITLTACSQPISLGTAAPDIRTDRGDYLAQKNATSNAVDISSVIAFVETMNQTLSPEEQIKDYTTSYDAEDHTVFVKSDKGTLAFRLDSNNDVQFVSSSGTPEEKAALSHGIAAVYIGLGEANSVDALFNQAEETRWLNNINCKVVEGNINSFALSDLDLSLLDATPPSIEGSSDVQDLIDGGLQMPVLTDKLEEAGLDDLTDYFESPSLNKYWTGIDTDSIHGDISKIESNGTSLRDYFNTIKLDPPADTEIDTSWKEESPNWNVETPTLPGGFSDGTSADLDGAANDTLKEFQNKLDGFKTEAD